MLSLVLSWQGNTSGVRIYKPCLCDLISRDTYKFVRTHATCVCVWLQRPLLFFVNGVCSLSNFEYLLCLTCSFLCILWKLSSIIPISFRDYMLTFFKRVIQVQIVTWSGHSWCYFSLTCLNGYDNIDVLLNIFIYLKECMLEWIWKYQCFINKFIY